MTEEEKAAAKEEAKKQGKKRFHKQIFKIKN